MGIFEPYRAIGYITSGVPFSVQRLGTETFVTVSVGKAFQVYNVLSLSLSIHRFYAKECLILINLPFCFFSAPSLLWFSSVRLYMQKKIKKNIYIYVNNNDVILCVYFKTLWMKVLNWARRSVLLLRIATTHSQHTGMRLRLLGVLTRFVSFINLFYYCIVVHYFFRLPNQKLSILLIILCSPYCELKY